MVEIIYKDVKGEEQFTRCHPKNAADTQRVLTVLGHTIVGVSESYVGEIADAEAAEELKEMLPKLRQIVAKFLPAVVLASVILRKLHLVRPDLIPFPIDVPVYA